MEILGDPVSGDCAPVSVGVAIRGVVYVEGSNAGEDAMSDSNSEKLLPFIYVCPECGRHAIYERTQEDRDKQLWCGNPIHPEFVDVVWIGHTKEAGDGK